MYVNKIDETIDTFIDDFYNKVVIPDITKFYDDANFVKFQKDINKLLTQYFDKIDKKVINDVLNNEENTNKLIEYIKKYIGYYVILTIGFFYKHKYETFMNNVIEFSKNQYGYSLKIDNFFNSDSNAFILQYYTIIKNILMILDADSVKMTQLTKRKDFRETFSFLDMFGQEYIEENFKLKNLHGKVSDQAHNIIKTIIISEIYVKQDKQNVHMFLEQSEIATGEFIYIDVVVQTGDVIDYNMIESVLSIEEINNGFATEIYELLVEETSAYKYEMIDHDKKVVDLIERGFVIPVSEDFLLYHKDTENYDRHIGKMSLTHKRKDEPKIKYIVNKIEMATDLYTPSNNTDKTESIKKLFDPLLADVEGLVINHYEDSKIMSKIELTGKSMENNEYYNDMRNFMKYPFINYKNFKKEGFSIVTPRTFDTVRAVTFGFSGQQNKNRRLQIRSSNPHNPLHITGLIIPNNIFDIKCAKISNVVNLSHVKKIDNTYDVVLNVIDQTIQGKKFPHLYWSFNLEKDKVKFDNYDVVTNLNVREQTKMIVVKLYDDILHMIMQNILNKFSKMPRELSMQQFTKFV
jgi:hypothetical protein